MKAISTKIFSLLGAATLVACGGGGSGSNTSTSTPGQAQGFYSGSFATAAFPAGRFSTLILDNDEIWTLYGEGGVNGELLVYGLIQGQGLSNSGSFASSSLKDYFYDGTTMAGSISATYQMGASFNGTVSAGSQSASFSGVVPTAGSTTYSYNTAANLTDISGNWAGTSMAGSTSNYTISSSGTFSGTNQNGCGFSGTVMPRNSGKNVFDVAFLNNTSSACGTASGLSARGIAVNSLLANGSRQLIVAVVTADRSYGSAIFATR